jgi:hypothetical protein
MGCGIPACNGTPQDMYELPASSTCPLRMIRGYSRLNKRSALYTA